MKGWLDFSGAPALVIPAHVVPLWRGITDPETGASADPNFDNPRTDFDRVCATTMSVAGAALPLGGSTVLVLSLETDHLLWDAENLRVAGSTEPPTRAMIERVDWKPVMRWRSEGVEHLLMNAAGDGAALLDEEWLPISLPVGDLDVELAKIQEDEYWARCHRLRIASG